MRRTFKFVFNSLGVMLAVIAAILAAMPYGLAMLFLYLEELTDK